MDDSKERIVALTTIDNKFDPIDDWDKWWAEDRRLALLNSRRDTCSMLALFARTSEKFSDLQNSKEKEFAIDEIIKHDVSNIYLKLVKN